MDPATSKFHQALPFALLPVSSQLAAFHTSRTRSQLPSSCSRCGSQLTSNTRVLRLKRNARPLRSISTTCYVCGAVTSVPVEPGHATQIPCLKGGKSPEPMQDKATLPVNLEKPSLPAGKSYPGNHSAPATGKTRKKSGLHEMLQRHREQDKKHPRAQYSKPVGLSDFLSTL